MSVGIPPLSEPDSIEEGRVEVPLDRVYLDRFSAAAQRALKQLGEHQIDDAIKAVITEVFDANAEAVAAQPFIGAVFSSYGKGAAKLGRTNG